MVVILVMGRALFYVAYKDSLRCGMKERLISRVTLSISGVSRECLSGKELQSRLYF